MYLFDPRTNTMQDTNNPALLFADIMVKQFSKNFVVDNRFWVLVANLANICDGKNHRGRKVSICKNEDCKYQVFVDKIDDDLKKKIERKKPSLKNLKKRLKIKNGTDSNNDINISNTS